MPTRLPVWLHKRKSAAAVPVSTASAIPAMNACRTIMGGCQSSGSCDMAGAADFQFLHRLRQARLGTANRKAAPESLELLVPPFFRSSCERLPACITNFGSGALACRISLKVSWPVNENGTEIVDIRESRPRRREVSQGGEK